MISSSVYPDYRSEFQRRYALKIGIPVFNFALLYSWSYLYFRIFLEDTKLSSVSYILAIFPAVLIVVTCIPMYLNSIKKMSIGVIFLYVFIAASTIVSFVRSDWSTLQSAGLLASTLAAVVLIRPTITLQKLNLLFTLSIFFSIFFYMLGWSDYGFLPGQFLDGIGRGIEWRISLFPFVPESGFFALVVIVMNQILGRGVEKYVWMIGGLYFLLFSGVRSALIIFLLIQLYFLFNYYFLLFKTPRARLVLFVLGVTILMASLLLTPILGYVRMLADGGVGSYLFRENAADLTEQNLIQSAYRGWLWQQHWRLFLDSPLVGQGTFVFSELVSNNFYNGERATGSESYLTSWLARLGSIWFFIVMFFVWLLGKVVWSKSHTAWAIFFTFFIAMLTYGSFITPYGFMFLLFLGLLDTASPYDESTQSHYPSKL
ncbi:MAG: O-antigen ligase family protein [Herminiimonas sp.]|uniref:O-antigen ligase family protein n=1 Tax=Herminiimonas sp. TaxID=1926289 RepID=UPI0027187198|nr:O-antigen ligase family protein [Herminiimonas sp.]MDO9419787.1 O-antigen ligase family protein [Herminiimonas sp.]